MDGEVLSSGQQEAESERKWPGQMHPKPPPRVCFLQTHPPAYTYHLVVYSAVRGATH